MVAARRWHLVDLAASPEVTAGRKTHPAMEGCFVSCVREKKMDSLPYAFASGGDCSDAFASGAVVVAMHSLVVVLSG